MPKHKDPESLAFGRLRSHYACRVRERIEEFLKDAALIDIMLLSDLVFGDYHDEEGDLAERMLHRLGFGCQGPGAIAEPIEVPDGVRYEIDVVGTPEDDGDEGVTHPFVELDRFEVEEIVSHLAWMRGAKGDSGNAADHSAS